MAHGTTCTYTLTRTCVMPWASLIPRFGSSCAPVLRPYGNKASDGPDETATYLNTLAYTHTWAVMLWASLIPRPRGRRPGNEASYGLASFPDHMGTRQIVDQMKQLHT